MPTVALYSRTSTPDQSLDPQLDALRAYAARRRAEALEFTDHGASGARDSRPGLTTMMAAVRRRRISAVACTKLDRLARSTRHLCELIEELEALGVDLVVLDQAIDTSTPTGKLVFHVLGAVAEFERELIRERVRAGMAAAKRRGKHVGRPGMKRDRRLLGRVRRLRAGGKSLSQIAAAIGVSKSMAAKLVREAGKARRDREGAE